MLAVCCDKQEVADDHQLTWLTLVSVLFRRSSRSLEEGTESHLLSLFVELVLKLALFCDLLFALLRLL